MKSKENEVMFLLSNLKSSISNLKSNSGYTLYLILVVLLIAGILFSISIRSSGVAHIFSVRHVQSLQAKLLAQSGITRTEYFLNGGDGHDLYWETDKFEENIGDFGNIDLSCKRFGVYARVVSKGKRLKKEYTIEALISRDITQNLEPVLTLTGHVGGLVLERNTSLNGKVVIHHGKVVRGKRRDRIPGSEKWTIIRESPPLPFDIQILKDAFEDLSNQFVTSLSDPKAIKSSYSINNTNDSILKQSKIVILGDCQIRQAKLDHVLVVSSGTLTIEKGVECVDATFLCDELEISGGMTKRCLFFSQGKQLIKSGIHKSQFFSSDSINIEKDAAFSESNVWVCYRKLTSDTTITGGIYFPVSGKTVGNVICFSDTTEKGGVPYTGPSIVLGKNSSFTGCLITDGDIYINSVKFEGQMWARSLVAKKDKVLYKNWLLNCKISPLKRNTCFPLLGELPAKVSLVDVGY